MILQLTAQQIHRVGLPVWGIVLPALVFILSFAVTYFLYRHFAKELHKKQK